MMNNNPKNNDKAEQSKVETEQPKVKARKSQVIRRLLIGATLSTALVSFVATAQGLEMYIFTGNYLFAGVISAAIQGVLYALSVSGVSLILSKKLSAILKIVATIMWAALLFTSSIFSFVFISKTAYPDNVMRSDAAQNMTTYLQEKSYIFLDYVKELENNVLKDIQKYTSVLNGGDSGFKVANDDAAKFDQFVSDLSKYENGHADDPDFTNSAIRSMLEKIKSGNYSENDMDSCEETLSKRISELSDKIDSYRRDKATIDERIQKDNDRLETWSYNDEKYNEVFDRNIKDKDDSKKLDGLIQALGYYKTALGDVLNFLSVEFKGGTESQIHQKTIELASLINRDKINVEAVLRAASEIYDELIKDNTSATDDRVAEYSSFKQNISKYRDYIESKQSLEAEIEALGNYNTQMLMGKADSTAETAPNEQNEEGLDAWQTFWSERLAALLSEIQDLPNKENDKSGNDKTSVIKGVMNRRRLYLVKLNDFDRALSLLRESLIGGFHEHGTMVLVSFVFAFGLDLFSFTSGMFLYFFKPKNSRRF